MLSNLHIQSFDTRDEQEVVGYSDVMELVYESADNIHLTEGYIKQLHRDLLKYSKKDARHRGEYKTSVNNVVAFDQTGKQVGVIFETAAPFDTPKLMRELTDTVNDLFEAQQLHPLLIIALFVVVFLEIHPFQYGNGRLSRILTTLLLLRSGYVCVPYCSLESIVETNKENYYLALRKTQSTIRTKKPNWDPWVLFFLRSLQKQTQQLTKKIEQEQVVLNNLPELSIQILEYAKAHGRVTMNDMLQLTGSSRNTLKEHFRRLTKNGFLMMSGKGRGAWYRLAPK